MHKLSRELYHAPAMHKRGRGSFISSVQRTSLFPVRPQVHKQLEVLGVLNNTWVVGGVMHCHRFESCPSAVEHKCVRPCGNSDTLLVAQACHSVDVYKSLWPMASSLTSGHQGAEDRQQGVAGHACEWQKKCAVYVVLVAVCVQIHHLHI